MPQIEVMLAQLSRRITASEPMGMTLAERQIATKFLLPLCESVGSVESAESGRYRLTANWTNGEQTDFETLVSVAAAIRNDAAVSEASLAEYCDRCGDEAGRDAAHARLASLARELAADREE